MPLAPAVFLWDIDGTLVCTGKAGEKALVLAMEHAFGIATSLGDVDYRGRTDIRILHMLLEKHGLPLSSENIEAARTEYLRSLEEQLPICQGRVFEGVLDLLHLKPDQGVHHGLLTGNLRRGAELKLTRYNLWHHFPFGAFADDHWDRNQLSPFARERAHRHVALELPPELYVIGDTPHDIACGRIIGAKTVAVATGGYTMDELASHHPDYLFANLRDPKPWLEQALGSWHAGTL
jgi:phosphoglycolate phosphatase-like HAD superfamily hydrolase